MIALAVLVGVTALAGVVLITVAADCVARGWKDNGR